MRGLQARRRASACCATPSASEPARPRAPPRRSACASRRRSTTHARRARRSVSSRESGRHCLVRRQRATPALRIEVRPRRGAALLRPPDDQRHAHAAHRRRARRPPARAARRRLRLQRRRARPAASASRAPRPGRARRRDRSPTWSRWCAPRSTRASPSSVLLQHATPSRCDDGGIAFLVPYIEAVRRHFDTLVAAAGASAARATAGSTARTRWASTRSATTWRSSTPSLLARHCVGRARYIGRERYLEALARAAGVFPSGTVWSDLVLGLEPTESTIAGIDALARARRRARVVGARAPGTSPPVSPSRSRRVLAHLYAARVARHGITRLGWVRDLARGISPLDGAQFAGQTGGAGSPCVWEPRPRWRLPPPLA